ncbi:lysozyme inhibitor LprI family protein [Pseudomonas fontis]|uniref:lysozyme inhibitor LprI family protein n=1 Tax=Pseudomonas fontis TaxID=2942633 RepID=UPI00235F0006|nr:lysozyme inhibitor LprI family protein [Pseudomonas fontis]MDD0975227.1 lysozyme inhibitor LprI family protein [Pseudomonas fontis]
MKHGVAGVALAVLAGGSWAQDAPEYSAVYRSCMESAQSTASMSECSAAELKREDARLNQAYKKAMAGLEADSQGRLRDAQRLWVKYRDSNCSMYYQLTGGTMDILNGGGCSLSMTKARADELEALQGL